MTCRIAYDVIVWKGGTVHTYRKTFDWTKFEMIFAKDGYAVEILRKQEQIDNLNNGKKGESLIEYLRIYHNRKDGLGILELPKEYID